MADMLRPEIVDGLEYQLKRVEDAKAVEMAPLLSRVLSLEQRLQDLIAQVQAENNYHRRRLSTIESVVGLPVDPEAEPKPSPGFRSP